MMLLRRFLVVQALLLWQGGFVFYATVVVSVGSAELGAFEQGRVTREVTAWMNLIGAAAVAVLAWDQWAGGPGWGRRVRWGLWAVLAGGLVALGVLHGRVEGYIDFASGRVADRSRFYFWHAVYMDVATAQWAAGLAYVAVTLRGWTAGAGRLPDPQTGRIP